jgi:diacylglycerol kinase (ATP)
MATARRVEPAREAALIINRRSRSGRDSARRAREELELAGVSVRLHRMVKGGPDLTAAVREAIRAGLETIVVGGGDGTLSSAAQLLVGRPELRLGLLPVGTGNDTARMLGIPLDLEGACRVIADGHTEEINIGEANGRHFLHTALVGYPARANIATPSWMKRRLGKLAYAYSTLLSVLRAKPFGVSVTAGSSKWEGRTSLLVIGNGRFHWPARTLLEREEELKNSLIVYTPRNSRPLTVLRLLFKLVMGGEQRSLLLYEATDSVTVMTDPPQPVDLDGEYIRDTPIHFQLIRRGLRVLAPRR